MVRCYYCKQEKNENEFTLSGIRNHRCTECNRIRCKNYQSKNKDKISKYKYIEWRNNPTIKERNRISVHKRKYGLDADEFVKNKECEICGINNNQHFEKYGERLNINHRNNQGSRALKNKQKPDNNIDNLQVLCRSCHCKFGNENEQNYDGRGYKVWETRRLKKANHI